MFLAMNLLSIILALFAGVLCLRSKEGWGWFLFAAILTFSGSSAFRMISGTPATPAVAAEDAAAGQAS
jgi:hypothetical protein